MGFGGRPLAAAARTGSVGRARRSGGLAPDTRHQTPRRVTTCACSQELRRRSSEARRRPERAGERAEGQRASAGADSGAGVR
jgi:hypothetical protein